MLIPSLCALSKSCILASTFLLLNNYSLYIEDTASDKSAIVFPSLVMSLKSTICHPLPRSWAISTEYSLDQKISGIHSWTSKALILQRCDIVTFWSGAWNEQLCKTWKAIQTTITVRMRMHAHAHTACVARNCVFYFPPTPVAPDW